MGLAGNGDSQGRISLWTTPDGSASSSERLTIKSDGKIGINETSPDSLLHLTNNAGAGIRADLRLESSGTNNSAHDTMGEILFTHNDSNYRCIVVLYVKQKMLLEILICKLIMVILVL